MAVFPEGYQHSSPLDRLPDASKLGSKRKAPVELATAEQKRRRSGTPSSTTFLHTTNSPPEASSIDDILRRNRQKRLLAPVIAWTSDNLQLLECCFVPKKLRSNKRCDGSVPSHKCIGDAPATNSPGCHNQPVNLIRAATHICRSPDMEVKKLAITELLAAYGICSWEPSLDTTAKGRLKLRPNSLPFFFHGRGVDTLITDGIFSSASGIPNLAYVGFETIRALRHKYTHPSDLKKLNPPVASRRERKLSCLQPEKEEEDPYIAAILIAMAQHQRLGQKPKITAENRAVCKSPLDTHTTISSGSIAETPFPPYAREASEISPDTVSSFKVHLLAIPEIRSRSLYFYTASISSRLLDKFDMPSVKIAGCPVSFSYRRIPLTCPLELLSQLDRLCTKIFKPVRRQQVPSSN